MAIGYEYTILSRFWNHTDYISKIIDIPYNEYIISCFGKGASREHYYSIYIPEDADKIIIQFCGAYLEGFYEDGKKKINTLKGKNKLEIKDKEHVFIFNSIDFKEKIMSLAFRPINYFSEFFSFYYFRVLYTKKK